MSVVLAFIVGFFIGSGCMYMAWKKEAARGHFTIGDKLYRAEEVKPR